MRAALALALLVVAALPAAAEGRPVDVGLSMKFYGSRPADDQALNPVAPSIRSFVTAIRWQTVQPTCQDIALGRYDWAELDRAMERIAALNLQLTGVLRKAPPCATVGGVEDARPKTAYIDEWALFAQRVAERYGPTGTHIAHPLHAIEVWSEPNLGKSWDAGASDYGQTFVRVARSVGSADPAVRMVVGGIALNGRVSEGFLDRLFDVPGFRAEADVVGTHTYAPSPRVAIARLKGMRGVIRRNRSAAPMAITEHGWSTCPRPDLDTSNAGKCVEPAKQAQYLASYVRQLRTERGLGVSSFHWFTAQDFATQSSTKACRGSPKDFYGLYDFAGRAKPSQDVWEQLTATDLPEAIPPNPRIRVCRGPQA